MNTRLISQALAFGLAGLLTLATLGGVDFLAQQPHHEALLASRTPAHMTPAMATAPTNASDAGAIAAETPKLDPAGRG